MRSITALILREMTTRYGRTPGGYLWAMAAPLGMILLLGYVWSLLARTPSLGTSYFLFKGTGFMVLHMFTTLGSQVGQAMTFSKSLLFYPRVTWIDAILARFLLNALVVALVTTIILTGFIIYEDVRSILNWGKILTAMGLAALLGLGVGCLNCYLFQRVPVWQQLWAIISRPLFIISGVIFLYEDLPPLAQSILWYNPMLHLTGIMREGFYPIYRPDYISLIYVSLWVVIPMFLGLMLLRQFNRDLLNM